MIWPEITRYWNSGQRAGYTDDFKGVGGGVPCGHRIHVRADPDTWNACPVGPHRCISLVHPTDWEHGCSVRHVGHISSPDQPLKRHFGGVNRQGEWGQVAGDIHLVVHNTPEGQRDNRLLIMTITPGFMGSGL